MHENFNTPMMKQYLAIKKQYQDCLLFYRMGDFYELFLEDAYIGSKTLGITLTSRSKGKDGRIPMAGVPYHAVDSYLYKLVKAGHKVAICEQLSEPNNKGIVDRDVIRVVTPGTIVNETALDKKENNYIVAIVREHSVLSLSIADLSTGECTTEEVQTENPDEFLRDELSRLHPSECLISKRDYEDTEYLRLLSSQPGLSITPRAFWEKRKGLVNKILCDFFHVATLAPFDIEDKFLAQQATAALLTYLSETQKGHIGHIRSVSLVSRDSALLMDRSTMINLELFTTIREHDTSGSLLRTIDHTQTPMGARLLRAWLVAPLCTYESIQARHDAVASFLERRKHREKLQTELDGIPDIERTLSRLSVNAGNARDLIALQKGLEKVLIVRNLCADMDIPLVQSLCAEITTGVETVIEIIASKIQETPSLTLKDGNIIRDGVDAHLDSLRGHMRTGDSWLRQFEEQEKKSTLINSLKVRYNSVFGYYIDITKSNLSSVPKHYIRRQTLVSSERYITQALKEHEYAMMSATQESNRLEYALYSKTLEEVLTYTPIIQSACSAIATLDVLIGFATLAEENSYCQPKLLYSNELRIQDGRHPVVEKLVLKTSFVPNSVHIDPIKHQLLIITGPNMAGKSVFIRQVAIITLLCHMGSFVPAKSAYIGIVDRIFVRSGASDVITSGLSTFMVEMVETAHILLHATEKSLIIMDEIGRGTSTYDGISIAWAVATDLVTRVQAKTLFATHYHELQALEENHPERIQNYHMAVVEEKNGPVFLHTLLPGGATSSFGIEVAKLAGVPETVISIAVQKLHELERRDQKNPIETIPKVPTTSDIEAKIASANISVLTPLDALNLLADLQKQLNRS